MMFPNATSMLIIEDNFMMQAFGVPASKITLVGVQPYKHFIERITERIETFSFVLIDSATMFLMNLQAVINTGVGKTFFHLISIEKIQKNGKIARIFYNLAVICFFSRPRSFISSIVSKIYPNNFFSWEFIPRGIHLLGRLDSKSWIILSRSKSLGT